MPGSKPIDPDSARRTIPPPGHEHAEDLDEAVEADRREIERGVYERRSNDADGADPRTKHQ